jgi:hypothetical protein
MPIGQGEKLIERAHQGLVSFRGDPWCLGLQRNKNSVALSTAEAEYIVVGHYCAQLL